MNDPRRLIRLSTTIIQNAEDVPSVIRNPLVEALKGFIDPEDFEEQLEDWLDEGLERVTFDMDSLSPDDLAHPLIPQLLDPEAYELTKIELGFEKNKTDWIMILASGSNPMGFIFDPNGDHRLEVYDGRVSFKDSSDQSLDSRLPLCISVLWVFGKDGQSVLDAKDTALERWPEEVSELYAEPIE